MKYLLLFLAACTHAAPTTYPPSPQHVLLDGELPAFDRPTLAGGRVTTIPPYEHAVVVKFFAAYCAPCVRTLPDAESVHERYPSVVFVGISEDDSANVAASLVEKHHLTFPVVHDRDNVLSGRFRVTSMPSIFVADRQGRIRWVGNESATHDDLVRAVAMAESH